MPVLSMEDIFTGTKTSPLEPGPVDTLLNVGYFPPSLPASYFSFSEKNSSHVGQAGFKVEILLP